MNVRARSGEFVAREREEGSASQHSLPRSIALHLMPGVLIAAIYVFAAPQFVARSWPAGLALLLGFLFVGIPFELGWLLREGKKRYSAYTLRGVVLYREPMPVWQYVAFFVLLFALAFGALFLTAPLNEFLAARVFGWLPAYMLPDWSPESLPLARSAILVTLLLGLLIDGFVNPVVEELYFRGYLLPRLARLGRLAPLLSALLFTLQHYWQPYNYPLILLIQLPLIYIVWRKRNIYIAILTHCAGNIIGATLSLISFLGSS